MLRPGSERRDRVPVAQGAEHGREQPAGDAQPSVRGAPSDDGFARLEREARCPDQLERLALEPAVWRAERAQPLRDLPRQAPVEGTRGQVTNERQRWKGLPNGLEQ